VLTFEVVPASTVFGILFENMLDVISRPVFYMFSVDSDFTMAVDASDFGLHPAWQF
jgi:hypothetical protein